MSLNEINEKISLLEHEKFLHSQNLTSQTSNLYTNNSSVVMPPSSYKNYSLIEKSMGSGLKDRSSVNSMRIKRGLFEEVDCNSLIQNSVGEKMHNKFFKQADDYSINEFGCLRSYAVELEIENKEKDAEIIRLNLLVNDFAEALRVRKRKFN